MNKKILYPKLSYKLTGLCFQVHKKLGRFCTEKQYVDELELLFQKKQIQYKREYEISNLGQDFPKGNRVDFLIDNKILLDIKAKKFITKEDYNQMQRYLQSSNLELGLIVNFRNTYLKPKRILNTKIYSEHSDDNSDNSDRFEILEHVTDLKIRAFGKTKEELFFNSMIGMYEGARYQGENSKIKREIKVSSSDLNSLLVDFLSEILYLTEVNQEVYKNIQFQKFDDQNLEGILIGKKLKRMGVLIKGVTYHGLDINQRKDGLWQATILFDI